MTFSNTTGLAWNGSETVLLMAQSVQGSRRISPLPVASIVHVADLPGQADEISDIEISEGRSAGAGSASKRARATNGNTFYIKQGYRLINPEHRALSGSMAAASAPVGKMMSQMFAPVAEQFRALAKS